MARDEEFREWSLYSVFYPDLFLKDEIGLKHLGMTTENCRQFQRQSQELKSTSDDPKNWLDLAEPCDKHNESNSQKFLGLFKIVYIHSGLAIIRGDSCGPATYHPPQNILNIQEYLRVVRNDISHECLGGSFSFTDRSLVEIFDENIDLAILYLQNYKQLIEEKVNLWRNLPGYAKWTEGGLAGHRKWLENFEGSKPKERSYDA